MADAERVEEFRQRRRLGALERRQQVGRALFAEALERLDVGLLERVEVGRVADEARAEQGADGAFAHPLDVHRVARGEVRERALQLRRAGRVPAAHGRLALLARDGLAAGGADGGHNEYALAAGALLRERADDLGDNVPRLADEYPVADADAARGDVVLVVQRRLRDGAARDAHRLEQRLGREHAGAADLHDDVQQRRLDRFGRVFEGDGPFRDRGGLADGSAQRKVVDLDDRAVDLVAERRAQPADAAHRFGRARHADGGVAHRRDGEAAALQVFQRFGVGRKALDGVVVIVFL